MIFLGVMVFQPATVNFNLATKKTQKPTQLASVRTSYDCDVERSKFKVTSLNRIHEHRYHSLSQVYVKKIASLLS